MLGRELRDLVFGACSIAGIVLGGKWAAHHQYVPHACPSAPRGHSLLGQCVATTLSQVLQAWLVPIGIGLIIGASVGLALAVMIRPRTPLT